MLKKMFFLISFSFFTKSYAFDLQDLEKQLQSFDSIQGNFQQNKYIRDIPNPLQTKGNFLINANKLVWFVTEPFEVKILLNEHGIFQYNENNNSWSKNDQSKQMNLFFSIISGDTDEIKKHFQISLDGSSENWKMQLNPHSNLMKQIFSQIIIKGSQHIESVEVIEKQGDKTILNFYNLQKNNHTNSKLNDIINLNL